MTELRHADRLALEGFGAALAEIEDPSSFGDAVLAPIGRVVPCDYLTYNEIDVLRQTTVVIAEPFGALDGADYSAFQRYIGQHPVVAYSRRTGDGTAHAISDFLDRRAFHRSELYANFFRDARVEHQVAITVAYTPSLVIGVALNRAQHEFTARERLLLNLIRSHLVVAHRSLTRAMERNSFIAALEAGLSDHRRGVVVVTPAGRVIEASEEAQRTLSVHCGVMLGPGTMLPRRIAALTGRAASRALTLRLEGQGASLFLRYLGNDEAGHCVIAVDTRRGQEPPPLTEANLTTREHEILGMLASSKDNNRIAIELGISVRTVHKHLEHLYEKLGVRDRTGAAARWFSDSTVPHSPALPGGDESRPGA